jgi:hypothetical protein
MGLLFVGGGHEPPDARLGAVWRAEPVEGFLCNRGGKLMINSTLGGTRCDFEMGGVEDVEGTGFKIVKVAPCCVNRLVCLRIH